MSKVVPTVEPEAASTPDAAAPPASQPLVEQPAVASVAAVELPDVYEAFARVRRAIGAVGKEHENTSQHFEFRGIDDVLNAAYDPMVKHGLLLRWTDLERIAETRPTKNSGNMNVVSLLIRYTFIGPRRDRFSITLWGEGADSGDKATNKARAAALKYLFLHGMQIPTLDMSQDDIEASHVEAAPGNDVVPMLRPRRNLRPGRVQVAHNATGSTATRETPHLVAEADVNVDRAALLRKTKALAAGLGYDSARLNALLINSFGAAYARTDELALDELVTADLQRVHDKMAERMEKRRTDAEAARVQSNAPTQQRKSAAVTQ